MKFFRWIAKPDVSLKIHVFLFFFWIVVAVAALIFGFIGSTVFIAVLSIVALSLSHWASIQSILAEKEAKDS